MPSWTKAAEAQLDLHRWQTSEEGAHWMRTWADRVCGDNEGGKKDIYQVLLLAEQHKLMTAESIWVSPEMCQIVQMAREGFQPEPLLGPDFITMTGFCYFDTPLYMQDRNGMTVSIGAMSWCPYMLDGDKGEMDGMAIALYSSAHADMDAFVGTHKAYMRRWPNAPALAPLHFTVVQFADPMDDGDLYDENGDYTGADEWWKTVQVALRLMQQRISSRYQERLPRPDRRRAQRAGHPLEEVMVIRLRRPDSHPHEGDSTPVDWTHRWMVDGHWRNQPYADGVYRQIWISPYVKGPEDMPLVVKRRYYKWDR